MSEIRTILERGVGGATPPPDGFERMLRRRDRKRRNQRIAAGVVGIAVFVAAVWILGTRVVQDTTTPAKPSTVSPDDAKALEVANDFVTAFTAFDADRAITYLADNADISGLGANGIRESRLLLSYLEAIRYKQLHTSCLNVGSSASGSYVHCTFDFHSNGSDEIGKGPYSGSTLQFALRDGQIVQASMHWELGKYASQMWYPFKEWVSSNYPDDVAVMYEDTQTGDYALTPASIRLWKKHTREYVRHMGK